MSYQNNTKRCCQRWDSTPRLQGRPQPEHSTLDHSAILTSSRWSTNDGLQSLVTLRKLPWYRTRNPASFSYQTLCRASLHMLNERQSTFFFVCFCGREYLISSNHLPIKPKSQLQSHDMQVKTWDCSCCHNDHMMQHSCGCRDRFCFPTTQYLQLTPITCVKGQWIIN